MAEGGQTRSKTSHRTPAQSKRQKGYQGTDEQKKNRAARNKNRAAAEADGRVHKGDGKEVSHKKAISKGGSKTARANLTVKSRRSNRRQGTN
tara:strand:+ start:8799 stop:9074 length:276 start_codon:yes stop_codon:yes gene_type:complete